MKKNRMRFTALAMSLVMAAALAACSGGIFLIWADVLARVLMPNMEIPIGVITSVIGAPIFVYMMVRRSYGFGGKD